MNGFYAPFINKSTTERTHMKLNELFDSPSKYTWIRQNDEQWRAQFSVDDSAYHVMIAQSPGKNKDTKSGIWYIELMSVGSKQPELGQGTVINMHLTGKKHPVKVLSTTISIIDEFLDKVKPATVEVQAPPSGTPKSMFGIIDKLVTRYSKKGYNGSSNRWNFGDPTQRTTFKKDSPAKLRTNSKLTKKVIP
jgi:hypothetical protein